MAKRGAKSIFDATNKQKLVDALRAVKGTEGYAEPSRYHKQLMADAGLIAFDTVRTGGRGRPPQQARVTARGQALINFNPDI